MLAVNLEFAFDVAMLVGFLAVAALEFAAYALSAVGFLLVGAYRKRTAGS